MEENKLNVLPTRTCQNVGLKIGKNSLYRRAYGIGVETKSSAVKLISSIRATRNAI